MTMQLSVVTPEGAYYEGDSTMIEAPGWDGSFGILNNHAPMVTELGAGLLRSLDGSVETRVFIAGGYLEISHNKVTVLATFAVHPKDIDKDEANEDMMAALAMPSATEEEFEAREKALKKARAMLNYANLDLQ